MTETGIMHSQVKIVPSTNTDEWKMNSSFQLPYIFFIAVVNDPAFRRKTLLTLARPPLGVTESATDGVVAIYDSYDECS
jgi:hypothetical protein